MKSGYNIEWTSEAERNLSTIFDYLEENWTQWEISNFAIKLESNLQHISEHPTAFPYYSKLPHFTGTNLDSITDGIHDIEGFCLKIIPKPEVYKGNIYILTINRTGSACEPIVSA